MSSIRGLWNGRFLRWLILTNTIGVLCMVTMACVLAVVASSGVVDQPLATVGMETPTFGSAFAHILATDDCRFVKGSLFSVASSSVLWVGLVFDDRRGGYGRAFIASPILGVCFALIFDSVTQAIEARANTQFDLVQYPMWPLSAAISTVALLASSCLYVLADRKGAAERG